MEQDNGRFFNCAESVIIAANRSVQSKHYHSVAVRIASMFGGGIVGTGEMCGAVTGALMYLGLVMGTDGTEEPIEFDRLRKGTRELGQQFVEDFVEKWGSRRCSVLIAMDKGQVPPMGTIRAENPSIKKRCNDYVQWSTERIAALMESEALL
ncbi:MAG: C-GCAxxG-C-C family (seleno)protein [Candidatus Thorarchaeota archaeon]